MIKTFKRYSVVSLMILLCFFSAFTALCSGLISTVQTSKLIKEENRYAYAGELRAYIRMPQSVSFDTLSKLVRSINSCNIYLERMMIYFEETDGLFQPEILLKQNEALSLPTSKSIVQIPENGIVVSSIIGDADKLTIHSKTFRVIEKIDNEKYPFVGYSFTLNAADYFRAYPDALNEQNEITLRISSNKSDVYSAYSEIQMNVRKLLPDAQIFSSNLSSTNDIFQSVISTENVVSAGLFLFALINTIIISYYWVTVRRREIAIRKAFGATDLRIIRLMTAELLKLVGASAILALIAQIILGYFKDNGVNIGDFFILIGVFSAAVTLAIFIAMIVPMRYILRIQPSEGVKS